MYISRALSPSRTFSMFGKSGIATLLCATAVFFASSRAACQGNSNGEPLPIPVFTVTDFAKPFPPAPLSNGFIGIRIGANPLKTTSSADWTLKTSSLADWNSDSQPVGDHPWATVVGGFVWKRYFGTEGMAPAPYPLATDLLVDGVSMLEHPEKVTIHRQSLNLEKGELTTEMSFNPTSKQQINISVVQFASRSVSSLLCQQITLQSPTTAAIEIRTKIDITGTSLGTYTQAAPYEEDATDRVMGFETNRSKLGIALVVPKADKVQRQEVGRYFAHLENGRSVEFVTLASMVSDFYASDPEISAIYSTRWGEMLGFEKLREENRAIWSDIWKGRIKGSYPKSVVGPEAF